MTTANKLFSHVQYLKTTSRWIYYTSTLFIMCTAFDLYYRDNAIIKLEAKIPHSPVYPLILVLLNMASVIFICCHFTYCYRATVLLAIFTLICTLIYRKMNAVDFDWMWNTPNLVAIITGLIWIFSDLFLKEREGVQKDQNADSASNPTVTPSASPLNDAEKSQATVLTVSS